MEIRGAATLSGSLTQGETWERESGNSIKKKRVAAKGTESGREGRREGVCVE